MPETPTADIRSILDPLDVPKALKAAAWDAFNASRNDAEFRVRFQGIALPKEAKAALWDAKSFSPDQMIRPITHPLPVQEARSVFAPVTDAIGSALGMVGDVAVGAGKEIAGTAMNAVKLLGNPDNPIVLPGLPRGMNVMPPVNSVPASATEATNAAQSVGKGAANVAEFMAGGELLQPVKAAAMAQTGNAALKAVIGATGEGAAAAGVTAAQHGSTDNLATPALTAGVLSVAVPAALKLAGKLGMKIEHVLIKPTKADIEDGFDVRNVFKYRVGGTLDGTYDKVQSKLGELATEATSLRATNPTAVVNVRDALYGAAVELQKSAPRTQGMNEQILNALNKELRELDILVQNRQLSKNFEAPVDVAHQILQGVGERGAWTYGFRDTESAASEKVANAFYSQLRQGIESAIPDGSRLAEVNKAMGELIPIKQAIIRRIPVEARNQVMHMSDIVALTKNIPLGVLNRGLRSGTIADVLVKGSEKAGPLGDIGARLGGAAVAGGSQ